MGKETYHRICPNCLSDPRWQTCVFLEPAPLNEYEVDGTVFTCPNCGLKIIYNPKAKAKTTEATFKYIYPPPEGRIEYHDTPIVGITTRRNVRNMAFKDDEVNHTYYYAEIQYYGFYLRFAKEVFIPCLDCQEELQRIIDSHTIRIIESSNKIILLRHDLERMDMERKTTETAYRNMIAFSLRFLRYDPTFVPCYKCQKKLQKILENAELIIGNKDYEPMIEFFRKWRPLEEEWKAQINK